MNYKICQNLQIKLNSKIKKKLKSRIYIFEKIDLFDRFQWFLFVLHYLDVWDSVHFCTYSEVDHDIQLAMQHCQCKQFLTSCNSELSGLYGIVNLTYIWAFLISIQTCRSLQILLLFLTKCTRALENITPQPEDCECQMETIFLHFLILICTFLEMSVPSPLRMQRKITWKRLAWCNSIAILLSIIPLWHNILLEKLEGSILMILYQIALPQTKHDTSDIRSIRPKCRWTTTSTVTGSFWAKT